MADNIWIFEHEDCMSNEEFHQKVFERMAKATPIELLNIYLFYCHPEDTALYELAKEVVEMNAAEKDYDRIWEMLND